MSKVKIILISMISLFIIGIGGAFYYVSTKITPEEVKKQTLTQLRGTFPNAEVELGRIDLSFGFSIKLNLERFDMTLPYKGKKEKLVSVKNLSVHIPIWAVLTGGGTIEIGLKNPALSYLEFPKGNNWNLAMAKEGQVDKPSKSSTKETNNSQEKEGDSTDLIVPAFISNSQLNLKLTDLLINYRLEDKSAGEIELSRFLIKNLNFKSETAFELASKLKFELGEDQKSSLETLIIGSFNLAEVIEKGSLSTMFLVTLSDLKSSSFKGNLPAIKTDVKAHIEKNGNVKGSFLTSFENRNKIGANYSIINSVVDVSKVNVQLFLEDLAKIVNFNDPILNLTKSQINLNGSLKIDSKKQIQPSFNFSLSPGVSFAKDFIKGEAEAKGSFIGKKIVVNQVTTVLDGNIITDINGEFDPNQKELDLAKLKPFQMNVAINNLNLPKETIQKILYDKKNDPSKTTSSNKEEKIDEEKSGNNSVSKSQPPVILPPGTLTLLMNNIKIGDEDFKGDGKILIGGSSVITERLNFNYSKGVGKLTHKTKLAQGLIDNQFDFSLTNFDLLGLKVFLPPMLEAISGTFTGKVGGGVQLYEDSSKGLRHDVNVDVKAIDGEIRGINIKEKVGSIKESLSKIPGAGKLLEKAPEGFDDRFKSLVFVGNLKQNDYHIKNAQFIGLRNKVEITKVQGHLYPLSKTKEGQVDLKLKIDWSEFEKLLSKYDTYPLPVRLKGIGFGLTPDPAYLGDVVKKAAEKYAKKKAKKAVDKAVSKAKNKATEKVEKELKKVGGDKLKDLLKKNKIKLPW